MEGGEGSGDLGAGDLLGGVDVVDVADGVDGLEGVEGGEVFAGDS